MNKKLRRFECANCGTDGGLVGIIDTDRNGMTPCPVCRKPVMVLTSDAPAPVRESLLAAIPISLATGAVVGLILGGIVHAALWYIFSIDVMGWGWTEVYGFRLPYFYIGFVGLFMFYGVVGQLLDPNA